MINCPGTTYICIALRRSHGRSLARLMGRLVVRFWKWPKSFSDRRTLFARKGLEAAPEPADIGRMPDSTDSSLAAVVGEYHNPFVSCYDSPSNSVACLMRKYCGNACVVRALELRYLATQDSSLGPT